MHPSAAKAELRDALNGRVARMSPSNRAAESRSVSRRIIEALPPERVIICAYAPLPSEVDITPVLEHLLREKYPLFLPLVHRNAMAFGHVERLGDLQRGQFGILEPPSNADHLAADSDCVVLVPARGYCKDGRRLGRGNGGYDIWIREKRRAAPRSKFWGIAYECQIVQDIPMEAHDEIVHAIVTARGVHVCITKT